MKQSQFDILIDKRSGVKIIIPISPKLDPKHPLSIFSPLSVYKPSTPIHPQTKSIGTLLFNY